MRLLSIIGIAKIDANSINIPVITDANTVLGDTLNLVYMIGGAFAVIVIILAGFSYTTANGDPAKIAKAKNAIMYAVIGIVVVMVAFVVTKFVIGKF